MTILLNQCGAHMDGNYSFFVIWGVVLGLLFLMALRLRETAKPNEILVFSGPGEKRVVLMGGQMVRLPFVQRVDRMDASSMNVKLAIPDARSKDGTQLDVHGIASVRIAIEGKALENAIDLYLGMDRSQIEEMVKEVTEGLVAKTLTKLSFAQIKEDPQAFKIRFAEYENKFRDLGLVLESLELQRVDADGDQIICANSLEW